MFALAVPTPQPQEMWEESNVNFKTNFPEAHDGRRECGLGGIAEPGHGLQQPHGRCGPPGGPERRTIRTELENPDTRGEQPRMVIEGFNTGEVTET